MVRVGRTGKIQTVYNVTPTKKVPFPGFNGSKAGDNDVTPQEKNFSKNSISHSNKNVKHLYNNKGNEELDEHSIVQEYKANATQPSLGYDRGLKEARIKAAQASIEEHQKKLSELDKLSAAELYRNTAGEIEARDAASRINMTAEERRQNFPEAFKQRDGVVFADGGTVHFSYGVEQQDIDNYVDAAYVKENKKDYMKYATPSQRLKNDLMGEVSLEGYSHALRDNDIRHIKNSHGEGTGEKYPVSKDDIKKIPYIVENYDKVFYKTNAKGVGGIVYVKVLPNNTVYYVEAITTEYHNEKLLVNKQMIKVGLGIIPNLHGLIDAINKKQSNAQYLADLEEIRKAYVQDVKEHYSNNRISQNQPIVKKSRKNVSSDADAEYIAAVSNGDIDIAQRLVDERAKSQGYTVDTDWRMAHTAPSRKYDKPAYDLRSIYG